MKKVTFEYLLGGSVELTVKVKVFPETKSNRLELSEPEQAVIDEVFLSGTCTSFDINNIVIKANEWPFHRNDLDYILKNIAIDKANSDD